MRRYLALEGPSTSTVLRGHLGISQATFSRLVTAHASELLTVGRARATRYAARRIIATVGDRIPLYEIEEDGSSRRSAVLHAVESRGFYVEGLTDTIHSGFSDDLPYFLADLRPSGFLGRLIPRRHPELGLPPDIQRWSTDHTLRYLTHLGSNAVGQFILGEEAFALHLRQAASKEEPIRRRDRARVYAERATEALNFGPVGTSAAGEQPKFLASRLPGPTEVLVKFSPPIRDEVGRRTGDLLIAEHLASEVLQKYEVSAARSEILESDGRIFLEVQRFDRVGVHGRRGVLSLQALDAEFGGAQSSWSATAGALHELGKIDSTTAAKIEWLELFGRLIANDDMHSGNLSFLTRGESLLGLAPVYDMGPAAYAPRFAQLPASTFHAPAPRPRDAAGWAKACDAAVELWGAVGADARVSEPFRALALRNRDSVSKARALAALLPR